MKSRSAIFVFVLLLLTVTVCSAQSPMGFSPTEFYTLFDMVNDAFEGPDCIYMKGDEEEGAFIINSDTLGLNMMYSDDQVTELYFYYKYLDGDEDASNDTIAVAVSTLTSLWAVSQLKVGVDFDTIDGTDAFSEILAAYVLISISEEPSSYWGYRFEMITREEDGYKEGLMYVTMES